MEALRIFLDLAKVVCYNDIDRHGFNRKEGRCSDE